MRFTVNKVGRNVIQQELKSFHLKESITFKVTNIIKKTVFMCNPHQLTKPRNIKVLGK